MFRSPVEKVIFSALVVAAIVVFVTRNGGKYAAPSIPKPTPHSAPLYIGDGGEQPWIDVEVCNQPVRAVLDTGSSKAVLNVTPCVPTRAPSEVSYAQGSVQVRSVKQAVDVVVGDSYALKTALVDFTTGSSESVLGINNASPLRNRSFSLSVSPHGRRGGWFTIGSIGAIDPSKFLSLPLRSLGAFLVVQVQVQSAESGSGVKSMLAILDTGSTDIFVDGAQLAAGAALTVRTADGKNEIGSFPASLVRKNEGGEQFTRTLRENNAFILGFPFFWGKHAHFDRSRGQLLLSVMKN